MIPTPIADFLDRYAASDAARFHMPGHKGRLSPEAAFDLTEIDGAGDLFSSSGVVAESEKIASSLFGCPTYYSAEGSSLAIRAMLALCVTNENRRVLAARNAHRAFLSAAILLDLDVTWLVPGARADYLSCPVTAGDLSAALDACAAPPAAVYVTSPDYLGHTLDIAALSAVCRARGVPLVVDNAHGAYLHFLSPARHPMDLGADLAASSAHKTLPALTGAAYLQLSPAFAGTCADRVKGTLALFASSSPSYLILRSLDRLNRYLETYPAALAACVCRIDALRRRLTAAGFSLVGDEPLKLTLRTKPVGYTGDALARALLDAGLVPEFYDPDFVTLMLTPENTEAELTRLETALTSLEKRPPLPELRPALTLPERVLSPRAAFFAPRVRLPLDAAAGRVAAAVTAFCPPAVPIVTPGERIGDSEISLMRYYGVSTVDAVAEV